MEVSMSSEKSTSIFSVSNLMIVRRDSGLQCLLGRKVRLLVET